MGAASLQTSSVLFLPVQDGKTALMLASRSGHTEGVQLLLESRANIDAKDKACMYFPGIHAYERDLRISSASARHNTLVSLSLPHCWIRSYADDAG
jgi:ankyrin repeat protein